MQQLQYIDSLIRFKRREAKVVTIGNLEIGGKNPIRLQSMTNTDTNDTEKSAEQAIKINLAGGELVRLTTQGAREAENMENIRNLLHSNGYAFPLVADVHFNTKAAEVAASRVEKVRINPGNFADPAKRFSETTYTDEEIAQNLKQIEDRFVPFLEICKANNTAIRIGVNHGSLSDRIMSRFGDTPEGMVESCMEYLRIALKHSFTNIVISIKASNTRIMVQTVRLMVATMRAEAMNFPLHLGVTEAGEGEDGRIKSAAGIGALLADGIGDTIRVSLSEEPEVEIPVAAKLRDHFANYLGHQEIATFEPSLFSPFKYRPRSSFNVAEIGGGAPIVISTEKTNNADIVFEFGDDGRGVFVNKNEKKIALVPIESYVKREEKTPVLVRCCNADLNNDTLKLFSEDRNAAILAYSTNKNVMADLRSFILRVEEAGCRNPIVIEYYCQKELSDAMIEISADLGGLFIDGLADGLWIQSSHVTEAESVKLSFAILQATRARFTKTEFISCPGCGRTLFDLQTTVGLVKAKTSHLKGLKIAVMGCIVNGPGEMADADYGYVGAGRGNISLYKGKECIKKNIPDTNAVDMLIDLIKECGDWQEPE